jgi:hypothetical protein
MGMYDSITVRVPLPIPEELVPLGLSWGSLEFQTKDLDNCLLNYSISSEGVLLEEVVEREYIPRPPSVGPRAGTFWADVVEKSRFQKPVPYHGVIGFYTSGVFSEALDFWVEFDAFFIYGKLDKVTLREFKKTPSRALQSREWEERDRERQKSLWNRLKGALRPFGWRYFWSLVGSFLGKVSRLFSSFQLFVYRHFL